MGVRPSNSRLHLRLPLLQILGDATGVSEILDALVRGTQHQNLLALQVSFDLCESDNQRFLAQVTAGLPQQQGAAQAPETTASGDSAENSEGKQESEEKEGG